MDPDQAETPTDESLSPRLSRELSRPSAPEPKSSASAVHPIQSASDNALRKTHSTQQPTPAASQASFLPAIESDPVLADELEGLDVDQPTEEQYISTIQEDEVDVFSVLPEAHRKVLIRSLSAELLPKVSASSLPLGPGIDVAVPARIRTTYRAIMECLQKGCGDGPSVYDRLKDSICHVLKTSNREAYGSFEQILGSLGGPIVDRHLGNKRLRDHLLAEAKLQTDMLKAEGAIEERIDAHVDEETGKSKLPNIMRLYPYLSNAGIPRLFTAEKACMLNAAFKNLLDFDAKILTVKFWGVIYGLKNDYYIAEADADPPDDEEDEVVEETDKAEPTDEEGNEIPEIEGFENLPPLPKPLLKRLPPLVKEPSGSGVNRKSYYVAAKLDGTWTRLPPVTPDQIIISRKINRGFTGDLKAKVPTFPVFPGLEASYLCAQIARITAATQIAPNGYYLLDGDEDFEEGAPPPFNLLDNPDYKPPSLQDLAQPHMKEWVHCGQYILRQGRTAFYDAFEASKDEDEDEEDDEGESNQVRRAKYPIWYPEKIDWYEPESSVPPPLCSVINDAAIDGYPPWSLQFGSKTFPNQSFIVARSNLWPGASTIVYENGRSFFNVYIGNGLKYRSNFVPKMPGHVKHEKYDPTLHEEVDPTPEEEEDIRKAAGLEETDGEEEDEEEEENT